MRRKKVLRRLGSLLLASVLLAALAAVPASANEEASPEPVRAEGMLVCGLRGAALQSQGLLDSLEHIAGRIYRTGDAALAESLVERGLADYAEPDYVVTLFDETGAPPAEPSWNYTRMHGAYAAGLGLTGTGVRIGIIDSGMDAANANLSGAHVLAGYDYLAKSSKMTDDIGHGTCVAQVIAGAGVQGAALGLAPDAELVPLRCFGNGASTKVSSLIQALRDAVDVYHCDVVNMSWGLPYQSKALHDEIIRAYQAGVLLVAAAGNVTSADPQGTLIYPAAHPEVIGVGNLLENGEISPRSQQTEAVFVCAPGTKIPFLPLTGSSLKLDSGTSFSSPAVAAVAAQICQLAPGLTNEGFALALQTRAEDLGEPGWETAYGHGAVQSEALFGRTWCRVWEEGAAVTAEGWFRNDGGGSVIAASYGTRGEMRTCQTRASQADIAPIETAFSETEQGAVPEVRLFFLDGQGAPLEASVSSRGDPVK